MTASSTVSAALVSNERAPTAHGREGASAPRRPGHPSRQDRLLVCASEARANAAAEPDPEIKAALLTVARLFEQLAAEAEG